MVDRPVFGVAATLAAALTLAGILATFDAQGSSSQDSSSTTNEPRTFEGNWSAVGRRRTIPTEGKSDAAVIDISGAVVLTTGSGLGRGFLGEAIGFDDGRNSLSGRAAWTDARGDRVYSVFKGGAMQTGRRIIGTITGGTGAYTGIVGHYELTWQYVAEGEDNTVQGRATDLKGTFLLRDVSR
jgi:hypothetical protein